LGEHQAGSLRAVGSNPTSSTIFNPEIADTESRFRVFLSEAFLPLFMPLYILNK
jgi:hypothetical protein